MASDVKRALAPVLLAATIRGADEWHEMQLSMRRAEVAVGETWHWLLGSKALRIAQRRAALRDGERYLQIGLGTGRSFLPMVLANPSGRNEGVGACEVVLDLCRQTLARAGASNFVLRVGDVRRLALEDDLFDVVMGCYGLGRLPAQDVALAVGEMHRVLRRGGRLLLVNLTRPTPWLYGRLGRGMDLERPMELGPCLVKAGFLDVSRMAYWQALFTSEVLRGVKRG